MLIAEPIKSVYKSKQLQAVKLVTKQLIIKQYGEKEIKKTVCDLNYIDPKTLNFISMLFHIPKVKFRCYIRKQLTNQHWSY